MESLSVASSNLCKDCFCTNNTCYNLNVSDPYFNDTLFEVTVTDNPAPYRGFDLMDQACFNGTNSSGLIEKVCIPNLYFFAVNDTNKSNDMAYMDFQGSIGLVPDIHSENGTFE